MEMNINEVKNFLPHRYPFLLIDKVLDFKVGEYLTAIKNVSFNEPHFAGHFPEQPIMPGVLIIEALAQATGILAFKSEVGRPVNGQIYMLVGIVKRGIWKFNCKASVEGQLVTFAEIICTQKTAS